MTVDAALDDPDLALESRWRALVEKTLAGAAFADRLTCELDEGLRSRPLYVERDAPPPLPARLRAPKPFDAVRPWDVRVEISAGDPGAANAEALEALEGGASSLLLRLGGPGRAGTLVDGPDDMGRLLEGVHLDLAPVALDAGPSGLTAARLLCAVAERRTLKPRLELHMDPLSAAAETAQGIETLGGALAAAAGTALENPADSALLASGRFVHEAGGGEALELGCLGASLIAHVRALTQAGDAPAAALSRIALSLALDQDYFLGVAKIRAARRMFDAVARHLGVDDAPPARIEARSSGRMLSGLDVHVNMLRLTAAAFAGGAGGADAIALDPFDAPLGGRSALGRRQARNIQLVLMQEGGIADARDPAGGAFYLERLGLELAERGWAQMQAILRAGGVVTALGDGSLAAATAAARRRLEEAVATRRKGLVGVTEFPNLADPAPQAPGAASAGAPFAPMRLSAPFEALRRRAAAITPPPRAFLALLGAAKDHAPRAAFAANALAVAGVAADQGPPEAFAGGTLAVLCGGEDDYAAGAGAAAAHLKAKGARMVLLAGRDPKGAYAAAGIDGLLHAGMDHVRALGALLDLYAGER